ncbi:MAG: zinc-ribbon domain-containing protein [Myxococcota bacterium]|nr:zinc-ribbon domain-containing protein [Myxococcota bacterium]
MIVTCEACDTRFQLDDERIPSEGVRVRCSCCRHGFFVSAVAGDACGPPEVDPSERQDELGMALSDQFDRAVEEDRAEVLAREIPSLPTEPSEATPDPSPLESASPVVPTPATEGSDPVEAEASSRLPVESTAAPRPVSPIPRAQASDSKESKVPPVPRSLPRRVPRPPRLGRTATAVGWTLTLGLCALALLWEIRATMGG